jgi:hypothetical protein
MLLASINLAIGGLLGVYLGFALASVLHVSGEIAGAHLAMMVAAT